LVGAFDSFDAVSSGLADMYHAAETYWPGRSAAFNYFSTVPFGLTAAEINAWVYCGGGQALWDELSAGFVPHARPGCRLRRLGAVVVNLAVDEIIPSRAPSTRANGSVPGTTWHSGCTKRAKYYYYPGVHLGRRKPSSSTRVGQPRQHRARRHRDCRGAENIHSLAEFNAKNAAALEILINDPAIQIRKFDDSILQSLGKVSGEVLAETSRKDDLTRRVYESFMKFRATAVRWGEHSERSYLNARALKFPFGG